MQLTLAAAALIATASASAVANIHKRTANFNATCDDSKPKAKVVNRCSYAVNVWSIQKELGCPDGAGLTLNPGEFYHENLRDSSDGTGISIKLSKYETCGGNDLTQLEYYLNHATDYQGNYLDMSFVDCTSGDCPGWDDGFYFKAGNQDGMFTSAVDNEHCPIFSVYNSEEAARVSYVNWDDRQTKWCDLDASMELYLCGGEAPGESSPEPSAPSSTEEAAPSSTEVYEEPSSTEAAATSAPAYQDVAAAEVTPAPVQPANVKTEFVYTTVYVKEKRHAHGHRHQHFRA
ncbi:hypothetical protein BU26DRAFT_121207 [Trematosphaeria pertusa]|uniref:Uncharacterized protein n=1 Tax=Trematosphaeria pertusa TaxID=390896 RepID=A0A6A6HZ76_9PLEO|nr:uncharacterized protein BU26DRAFT_121207 [Trematosphaeria pertusa]KAF2242923.1 hypothetical protein BU26DRAFT_121207 [Trematosphaeria pertusa]